MTSDAELTLLNRILDEIKGLREDFRSLETKHGAHEGRLIKLEEDKANRERTSNRLFTAFCAFGALTATALGGLTYTVYANSARLETVNSYGTAYGRGQGQAINDRLQALERKR